MDLSEEQGVVNLPCRQPRAVDDNDDEDGEDGEDDINEDDEEEARDFTLSCFFFGVFVKACDKCV